MYWLVENVMGFVPPSGRLVAYSFCLTMQAYFHSVYLKNTFFPLEKISLFTSVSLLKYCECPTVAIH